MSAKLLHFKVYEFKNTENEKIDNEIYFYISIATA